MKKHVVQMQADGTLRDGESRIIIYAHVLYIGEVLEVSPPRRCALQTRVAPQLHDRHERIDGVKLKPFDSTWANGDPRERAHGYIAAQVYLT